MSLVDISETLKDTKGSNLENNFPAKTPFTSPFLTQVVRLTFKHEANIPGGEKTIHIVISTQQLSVHYKGGKAGGVTPPLSPPPYFKADL
jgi:hypothetical protein